VKKIFSIFIAALLFYSCAVKKKEPESNADSLTGTGYLKNLTGLESCGWLISMDKEGENKLEPLNILKFNLKLVDGKEVSFTYTFSNTSTTCMAGKVIELKSIKYK